MEPILGWSVHESQPDVAHEVFPGEADARGQPTYWTVCGALAELGGEVLGWAEASPGIERCRECYSEMAGAPDVD